MVGGAELAIYHIAKRIPTMRFLVLTARQSRSVPAREVSDNIEIHRLGLGFSWDRWMLPLYISIRRIPSHAVLWGMMISQGTIGAYILKRRYPALSFVVTLQEGDSENYIEYGRGGLISYWWKRVLGIADEVVVISSYLTDRAKHAGFHGLITLIPNGVDEHFVSEAMEQRDETELRELHGISSEDRIVLSVSRLVEKNGLTDLLRAHALVRQKGIQVKLVLVGDGPERGLLRALARDLECADSIIFAGTVDHDRILDYYRIADIFVRPSLSEGLGSAFLEAMGVGVPVVATSVGGIKDFLRDGETGVVVRPRDVNNIAAGIIQILEDDALKARIQTRARELVVTQYLWIDIAQQMKMVFERALL